MNRLQVGYDDNGSWEEGGSGKAVTEIHSRCFCVVCHNSWKNLTNNVDGSTEHKEEGELGHCLSVLSVLSDSVLLNVAEADNGHSNADSYWYEACNCDPYGEESTSSWNDNDIAVIRETGHTMDKLYFIHIRKHNVEAYSNRNKPEDGNDDYSIEQAIMVFFPNLTIASTENENAAKFNNLAADPIPYIHKFTLHRYSGGLGCSGVTTTRATNVPTINIIHIATTSPASRRLMRKSRSGCAMDPTVTSAIAVTPITTPATSAIIVSRMV